MNRAGNVPQNRGAGRKSTPLRVLIVEDEMLPAMLLEAVVVDAGHTARKAARLRRAIELASEELFDAAVLDVNLAGEQVFPLAALLRKQHVPFLFATGYGEAGVPPEYRDCIVLQKPYSAGAFNNALRALSGNQGTDQGRP